MWHGFQIPATTSVYHQKKQSLSLTTTNCNSRAATAGLQQRLHLEPDLQALILAATVASAEFADVALLLHAPFGFLLCPLGCDAETFCGNTDEK